MASKAGLPPGAFDAVVSSLVLCSVDDVTESAADLYRWLKPGGVLLFMEHMAHGQQTKAKRLCDKCAPAGLSWCSLGSQSTLYRQQSKAKRLDKCAPIGFISWGCGCHVAHRQQGKAERLSDKCAPVGSHPKSSGWLCLERVAHGQRSDAELFNLHGQRSELYIDRTEAKPADPQPHHRRSASTQPGPVGAAESNLNSKP